MIQFNLFVSVKFRALRITFGTVKGAWRLSPTPPMATEIPLDEVPANARTIFDKRGITLKTWD